MPFYRTQMTLKMVSNVSADFCVNTMHFLGNSLLDDITNIKAGVFSFYDDVRTIFPANVAQNGHDLKIYNLADPQPRYPIDESVYNFTAAPTGDALPHECAVVLSFQAERSSGIPQARRRNRIFLGPIREPVVTSDGRLDTAVATTIANAGDSLNVFMAATTPRTDWVVYSPTDITGDLVDNGWVDNAFDTQRRRGRKPTQRITF